MKRWSSLFSVAAILGAAIVACSSDDDAASPGGNSPDGTLDGGGLDGAVRGTDPDADEGPIVKKEFPLTTPALGGYTLVDAFPGIRFDIPSAVAWPKGQSTAFVLERTGQLKRVEGTTARTVLNYGAKVNVGGEGGAVGFTFHPQFGDGTGAKPYVYVWYNAVGSTQRLERYTWSPAMNAFDPASAFILVEEREFENVHNSGKMAFGSDGFLYFSNGDDIQTANHQTITNGLFAGIFRVDVDMDPTKSHAPPAHTTSLSPFTRQGYWIPNDNPFVGAVANGLEEFWALGFRNPFSWSFDRQTGKMWLGDVGDSFREEINEVVKGGNYQWPLKEGELDGIGTSITAYTVGTPTPPVFAYSHAEIADLSSVFGGIVYRGPTLTELTGKFLYSDWISNRIWALDIEKSPVTRTTLVDNQFKSQPMGIGEDNDGEFYILQYGPDARDEVAGGGHVMKMVKDTSGQDVPRRLKGTFLFDDVPSLKPAANLVPYEVTSPLWSDGAVKKRWIRLPQGQKVSVKPDGSLSYPVGTVFVKQFDLPGDFKVANRTPHLETRVMVVGSDTTYGYTFRWRPDGSDADLVSDGVDETLTAENGQSRNWHYPSFGECWGCHRNGWDDLANTKRNDAYRILGFTGPQLGDQQTALAAAGVFDAAELPSLPAAMASPTDAARTLEERAYAYLDANCAPCHHENAGYTGGGQTWIATYGAGTLAARGLDRTANNYPMTLKLGIPAGKLVAPGDPAKSVLLGRIRSNDKDLRMPPIARNVVDEAGAALIEQWIQSM